MTKLFESQGLTQKKVLALAFWMFFSFLSDKTSSSWEKHRQYGYKVLQECPFTGRDFLCFISTNMFIEEFVEWLKQIPSRKSETPIDIIADFTKTGKKYGKDIPLLYNLYDYVHKCHIKTHQICPLIICVGEREFIVDYELWDPNNRKGVNQTVQEMLKRFLDLLYSYGDGYLRKEFLQYGRLVLDGSWGNGSMLAWAKEMGFNFVVIKSGGKDLVEFEWNGRRYVRSLKNLENFLKRNKYTKWLDFNVSHELPGKYTYIKVLLVEQNIMLKVLLIKLPHGYLMLLSPNLELQSNRMFKTYKRRWAIEVVFRTSKQKCGLEKYSFHSEEPKNIELLIALRLLSSNMIHNFRIKHTKRKKTSLKEVIHNLEEEFAKLHPNAFQKLFPSILRDEKDVIELVKFNLRL